MFSLIIKGHSVKGAANVGEISPRTAEMHRQRVRLKMEASNVVQMAAIVSEPAMSRSGTMPSGELL